MDQSSAQFEPNLLNVRQIALAATSFGPLSKSRGKELNRLTLTFPGTYGHQWAHIAYYVWLPQMVNQSKDISVGNDGPL